MVQVVSHFLYTERTETLNDNINGSAPEASPSIARVLDYNTDKMTILTAQQLRLVLALSTRQIHSDNSLKEGSTSNRNGPEWAEMDRNGPEWTEMGRNVPKWEISFFIFPSCFLHLIIVYLNFCFSFVEMKDFICVSTEIT